MLFVNINKNSEKMLEPNSGENLDAQLTNRNEKEMLH
jgi:hypothetical protein